MALPTVLAVAKSKLKAKVIDEAILQSKIGKVFKQLSIEGPNGILGGLGKTNSEGESNGFLDFFSKSAFWLINTAGWTFQQLMGGVVALGQYFWNFNWNITGDQIDEQVQGRLVAIAGVVGGVLGKALGYTVCGATAGALIGVFSPHAARYVLTKLGDEALDEVLGDLHGLFSVVAQSAIKIAWLRAYQGGRALLKASQRGFAGLVDKFSPGSIDWETFNQQQSNNKHFSFARELEERIENIPSPISENFFEEFFEEFGEGCQDALYIIGGLLDEYVNTKKAVQSVLGPETSVIVTPNRKLEEDTVFIVGNERLIKPVITQTIANHQLIENRNLGMIVGSPANEYVRAKVQTRRLVLHFYNKPNPPYSSNNGFLLRESTISIPDVKRSVSWQDIKIACGGENGYLWGKYKANATLDNGRKLTVYCSSENEGENLIKRLLLLTTAELLTLSITEEKNEGIRKTNPNYRKEPTRMYPSYATILGREKLLGHTEGQATTQGNFKNVRLRLDLWPVTAPDNAANIINEAFTNTINL